MRKREALRRLAAAEADTFDARRDVKEAADAVATMGLHMDALRHDLHVARYTLEVLRGRAVKGEADLAIAEDALEAERQWRLTSLPALLAAEERANKAEAEVARLLACGCGFTESRRKAFPELWPSAHAMASSRQRLLAAAYHESKERP